MEVTRRAFLKTPENFSDPKTFRTRKQVLKFNVFQAAVIFLAEN